MKLLDNTQIDQRAADLQLQPELLAHFAGELQDHIRKGSAVATFSTRLLHRECEFLIDHLVHAFESRGGGEFLLDDVVCAFQRDGAGGEVTHPLEALVDGGFADAEVAGGVGLRVTGVEVGAQGIVGELGEQS